MAHTPGPWTVEPSDSGDPSVGLAPTPPVIFTNIPNDEDRFIEIAVIGSTIYDNSEDGHTLSWGDPDANARLIAAAPELLDVLRKSLDWLASYPGGSATNIYHAARAVIDKAEGRVA